MLRCLRYLGGCAQRHGLRPVTVGCYSLTMALYSSFSEVATRPRKRSSGHDIRERFSRDSRASIPPNLIAVTNTERNSQYLSHCRPHDLERNPARYPSAIPEYFVRMLTNSPDVVADPFAAVGAREKFAKDSAQSGYVWRLWSSISGERSRDSRLNPGTQQMPNHVNSVNPTSKRSRAANPLGQMWE